MTVPCGQSSDRCFRPSLDRQCLRFQLDCSILEFDTLLNVSIHMFKISVKHFNGGIMVVTRNGRPRIKANVLFGFDVFASRKGLDYAALLQRSDLTEADVADPEEHISLNSVARLLTLAAEDAGDPCLGLHWAEAFPTRAMGLLGYLLINASSVRHAVTAVARYVNLMMHPVDASYKEDESGGHLTVCFPPEFDAPRVQYISFAMALLISRLRTHAGKDWMPVGVDLEHRELPCRQTVLRLMGPNVRYDKLANTLHIRDFVLQRGSADADRNLYELIRQLGERLIEEQKSSADIVQQTRKAIILHLESGSLRIRDIADSMGVASGTLQSKLASAGTTFDDLLTSTRRSLSDLYLRDTELPLTEIAFLLGFSELSSFTRAAQRWYGAPPSQRRVELRM